MKKKFIATMIIFVLLIVNNVHIFSSFAKENSDETKNVSTIEELKEALIEDNSETITIKKDISITQQLEVKGTKKLKGTNNKNITLVRDENYKGNIIFINKGANLEIENLTIDGGGNLDALPTTDQEAIEFNETFNPSEGVLIYLDGSRENTNNIATLTLGDGAILQHNIAQHLVEDKPRNSTLDSAEGSAIFAYYNSVVNINGGKITENVAYFGDNPTQCAFGAGVFTTNGTVNMSSGEISGNYQYQPTRTWIWKNVEIGPDGTYPEPDWSERYIGNGGGIYIYNKGDDTECIPKLNITGGSISNNYASYGAGIEVFGGIADVNISGGIIENNHAVCGAGLSFERGGSERENITNISGGIFQNNYATYLGGAISYISKGRLNLSGGVIKDNKSGYGGAGLAITDSGIYHDTGVVSTVVLDITGGEIINNKADKIGGGIYTEGCCQINLLEGTISNNSSDIHGGACYIGGYAEFNIKNGKIINNKSVSGGAISSYEGTINMEGGEISGNIATGFGGGIRTYGGCNLTILAGYLTNNECTAPSEDINYIFGGSAITMCENDNLLLGATAIYDNETTSNVKDLNGQETCYYGGAISGCPTSETDLSLNGVAIFDNAKNENGDIAFQSSKGAIVNVANTMLGGGEFNWEDMNNNQSKIRTVSVTEETENPKDVALIANPTNEDKKMALSKAQVFITNNTTSAPYGAAISTNGVIRTLYIEQPNNMIIIDKELQQEGEDYNLDKDEEFTIEVTLTTHKTEKENIYGIDKKIYEVEETEDNSYMDLTNLFEEVKVSVNGEEPSSDYTFESGKPVQIKVKSNGNVTKGYKNNKSTNSKWSSGNGQIVISGIPNGCSYEIKEVTSENSKYNPMWTYVNGDGNISDKTNSDALINGEQVKTISNNNIIPDGIYKGNFDHTGIFEPNSAQQVSEGNTTIKVNTGSEIYQNYVKGGFPDYAIKLEENNIEPGDINKRNYKTILNENDDVSVEFLLTNTINPLKTNISVSKEITGTQWSQNTPKFQFTLEEDENNPDGATVTNNKEIEIINSDEQHSKTFNNNDEPTIIFTKPGTYSFTVSEVQNNDSQYWVYDNNKYTLKYEIIDKDGQLQINENTFSESLNENVTMDENKNINIKFSNHYQYGSLKVSKTVLGTEGDKEKEFTFTVTLSDTTINDTYGDMTFENGIATFTLKDGESKTATNLPIKVTYKVEETNNEGYTVTSEGESGTIEDEKESKAEFINGKDGFGGIKVSKTVVGTAGDKEKEFTFTVKLNDTTINGIYGDITFENGVATFTLKDGESKAATNLPSKITYKVEETNNEGYIVTSEGESGIIEDGKESKVEFINRKDGIGSLRVDNTVIGIEGDKEKEFTYTVTLSDTTINGTYGDMTFENGVATFTLKDGESKTASNLPSSTTYNVKETNNEGFIVTSEGESGTIEDGKESRAEFVNKRDIAPDSVLPKTGSNTTFWLGMGINVLLICSFIFWKKLKFLKF